MAFIDKMIELAKSEPQTIILPESTDRRVLEAAVRITREGIARLILLGSKEQASELLPEADFTGIKFIDPETSADLPRYAAELYEMRKHKGLTEEKALAAVRDVTTFGMMLLHEKQADGLVSGAVHSTADTLRPALQILKTRPGMKLVSGFFMMAVKEKGFGLDGTLLFSDCALNENPSAEQLAEIALASADTFRFLTGADPRVAMCSYSSFGSAKSEMTEKVVQATRIAKEKAPELILDGELQIDTALVPSVARLKAAGSRIQGDANVLIFPDLNTGNIAYKLVQYLGGAQAYGPMLQGIAMPVNDLSRGCSAEDIRGVVAITAVQAIAARRAAAWEESAI